MRRLAILLGLLAVLAVCGCLGSSLNSNSPDYIKSVSAIKQGDGIQVYFILADKDGQETTSDGKYKVVITNSEGAWFSLTKNVTASAFQKAKLGVGNFEHEATIYLIGRIPYSDLEKYNIPNDRMGKVEVFFTTPDNRTLKGDDTVFF